MTTASRTRKSTFTDITRPSEPIHGEYIRVLEKTLNNSQIAAEGDRIRATDTGFLLNIPIPRIPMLAHAPSSVHRPDKRARRGDKMATKSEKSKSDAAKVPAASPSDDGSIRPNLAILIRLLLEHPEYASMLPPKPGNRQVHELITDFLPSMEEASEIRSGRRGSVKDKRRYFAPLFGRSVVSSYKMLPPEGEEYLYNARENSQPVIRIQMLIMERFGKIFHDIYQAYRYRHMPEFERNNPRYLPTNHNWLILNEQSVLTEWMNEKVQKRFQEEVQEEWRNWFENCYLETLEAEAASRDMTLKEALKTGKWTNKKPVSKDEWSTYPPNKAPILGDDNSPLCRFRENLGLSSPEMLWLLGLQIKSFFRYRERSNQRIDTAVSVLVRHFYNNPDDLALFITPPPSGEHLLRMIQSIDPGFQRRHIGLLFGGGVVAGYNMTQPGAEVSFFAHRLASIFVEHIQYGTTIYWHLREAVEAEVKARGLDITEFWKTGAWYHEYNEDDEREPAIC